MMIAFLDFFPMCTNSCFHFWEPESMSPVWRKKTPQNPHAIIRFLCKCVNTFWLGSFQRTEVAFDVFDSTWEGKEGDKSHPLWVQKIKSKNMAYTYVHVLQIHVCHLEKCKSGHDICLRDGSEAYRRIVMTFLTIFFGARDRTEFWLRTTRALCSVSQSTLVRLKWGGDVATPRSVWSCLAASGESSWL